MLKGVLGSLSGLGSTGSFVTKAFNANRRHFNLTSAAHIGFLAYGVSTALKAPPEERAGAVAQELLIAQTAIAYPGAIGFGVGALLSVGLQSGNIVRGLAQGLKTGVEQRTMAAVPFSFSNQGNIQAGAAFQHAQKSMSSAYTSINEASIYASRYMSR